MWNNRWLGRAIDCCVEQMVAHRCCVDNRLLCGTTNCTVEQPNAVWNNRVLCGTTDCWVEQPTIAAWSNRLLCATNDCCVEQPVAVCNHRLLRAVAKNFAGCITELLQSHRDTFWQEEGSHRTPADKHFGKRKGVMESPRNGNTFWQEEGIHGVSMEI